MISNMSVTYPGGGTKEDATNVNAPELADNYPEYYMWGILPAYGLYARHANALSLNNVRFELASKDARPAIVCDDMNELDISDLRAACDPEAGALIKTRSTRDTHLDNCRVLGESARPVEIMATFE